MTTPTPQSPFGQPAPGGWGTPPPVAPPATKPSRRKAWLTHGAVALVALGLGAGIGSAGKADEAKAAAPAPAATTTPVATPPKAPGPAPLVTTARPTTPPPTTPAQPATPPRPPASKAPVPKVSGDGEYLVGQDMKPGTYKTAGPGDDNLGLCYWERDKDSSGDFDSIITNGTPTGTGRVTVKKGEVFKTQGCDDWTKVG